MLEEGADSPGCGEFPTAGSFQAEDRLAGYCQKNSFISWMMTATIRADTEHDLGAQLCI